jgi:FlaA1/EpsC-like NDP-sugar epimerase
MGEPVRIIDLATDLVRLSGFRPKVRMGGGAVVDDGEPWDIEVVFTGVRAGEKLYEEMFAEGEDCHPTRHDKIMVADNGQHRFARVHLDERLARLAELVRTGDAVRIQRLLQEIVPEYTPQPQESSGIVSHEAKAEAGVGRARRAA